MEKTKKSKKKTAGIILAAGESKRMGKTKQLLPFKGSTMLGHVISQAKQSMLYEIITVLGHDTDRIMNSISFQDMKIIINPNYKKGQSTSLIKGLSAIAPECDGAMFLLADQPLITSSIINKILTAFENSNIREPAFVIPFCRGRRGNPVIAARNTFKELESLKNDTGARAVFTTYKNQIIKINIEDDGILFDIDIPSDFHYSSKR